MLAPTATATFCLFHFPEMLEIFQSIIALHIKKKIWYIYLFIRERERGEYSVMSPEREAEERMRLLLGNYQEIHFHIPEDFPQYYKNKTIKRREYF